MLDFHPAANRYPMLEGEAYEAFKADIDRNGLQEPIVLDRKTLTVLDGRNRYRACRELGIDCVTSARFYDGDDPRGFVRSLNLHRRHLGPIAWAKDFAEELEARGVKTSRGPKGDHPISATVAEIAQEFGVSERTARNRLALAEELKDAPDLAAKVDNHEMTAKRAERVNRERKAEQRRVEPVPQIELPASIDLRHGDFREVLADIPDSSVDLIFTDPPYPKKYLDLWEPLAGLASRVLKPGGLLVTYSGQMYLPEVMQSLSTYLRYVWCGAIIVPGAHNQVQPYHIRNGWKPILFYAKDKYPGTTWIEDTATSEGRDKSGHDWQQSVGPAAYYIERLCPVGGTVLDPFLGSGTTGLAARTNGRRFIGCDVDQNAYRTALERMSNDKAT